MRVFPLSFLLLVAAPPAFAETVTYQLTGVVTSVTDGTDGTYDLRSQFSNGQAVSVNMQVERATQGYQPGEVVTTYAGAVVDFTASIGTYYITGEYPFSVLTVVNDNPNALQGSAIDNFDGVVNTLTGDPIGTAMLSDANFRFEDAEGTALSSQQIPRTFPPIADFETRQMEFSWSSHSTHNQGDVLVLFSGAATPVHAASWGAIKGLYR